MNAFADHQLRDVLRTLRDAIAAYRERTAVMKENGK